MKYLKISICFIVVISMFCVNAFALTSSTYGDLSATSSQSQNLLSYAMNYDSFLYSDYVIYQGAQYSYYIVWADKLEYSNGKVTGSNVEYISYIRNGSGYDYHYNYDYGTDSSFTLNVSHMTISNVQGLGLKSEYYTSFLDSHFNKYFIVFGLASLFTLVLTSLRRH